MPDTHDLASEAGPAPTGPEAAVGVVAVTPELHEHGVARRATQRMRAELRNWRLALVRLLTSALTVVLTVAIVPGLRLQTFSVREFLLIGLVFGLLNALVKPVLQFFTLRYLLPTYGLVVILINAVLLALMSWLLGGELSARGLLPFFFGGLLVGVIGLFLDTVVGATPPILDRGDTGFAGAESAPSVPATLAPEAGPPPVRALTATAADAAVLAAADDVLAGRDPGTPAPPPSAPDAAPPTARDATAGQIDDEGAGRP